MAPKLQLQTNPVPPRAIILDTETTGFTPKGGHRTVELGAVELIDGHPSGREFHAYINPRRSVPAEAERVHGLGTRFLSDKPTFAEILPDWLAFLGAPSPAWAHNAAFDQRFLEAEHVRAGAAPLAPLSCSLRLSRALFDKGKHGLESLAVRAGVSYGGRGAHSALADSVVLGKVLTRFLWPAEARLAAEGPARPRKPAPRRTREDAPGPRETPVLPEGFEALTPETDTRIRRYDDLPLDGRLTKRGARWTRDEEILLVTGFVRDAASIDALVTRHGRTPAALLMKLHALGAIADHPYTR